MKLDIRTIIALAVLLAGAGALLASWHLPDKSPFVALATLMLRELSAVRAAIFPTRHEEARP